MLAIHTPTKEQAEILTKVFDKMGEKWADGDSYLDKDYWDSYKENTAYSNDRRYANVGYYKVKGTVYEFNEVDMEKYLEKLGIDLKDLQNEDEKE